MALFRTIPVDVEAVQYKGIEKEEPVFEEMGASIPSWLWRGITKGTIKFTEEGVKVGGKKVEVGDWIIFDGVFLQTMDPEKFDGTFVPARKPINEMASAPKPMSARKAKQAVAEGIPANTAAPVMLAEPYPEPHPEPHPEPVAVVTPVPAQTAEVPQIITAFDRAVAEANTPPMTSDDAIINQFMTSN